MLLPNILLSHPVYLHKYTSCGSLPVYDSTDGNEWYDKHLIHLNIHTFIRVTTLLFCVMSLH